jgi:hypothetical protein
MHLHYLNAPSWRCITSTKQKKKSSSKHDSYSNAEHKRVRIIEVTLYVRRLRPVHRQSFAALQGCRVFECVVPLYEFPTVMQFHHKYRFLQHCPCGLLPCSMAMHHLSSCSSCTPRSFAITTQVNSNLQRRVVLARPCNFV